MVLASRLMIVPSYLPHQGAFASGLSGLSGLSDFLRPTVEPGPDPTEIWELTHRLGAEPLADHARSTNSFRGVNSPNGGRTEVELNLFE